MANGNTFRDEDFEIVDRADVSGFKIGAGMPRSNGTTDFGGLPTPAHQTPAPDDISGKVSGFLRGVDQTRKGLKQTSQPKPQFKDDDFEIVDKPQFKDSDFEIVEPDDDYSYLEAAGRNLKGGYAELASGLGSVSSYFGERTDSDVLRQTGESMKSYWDKVAEGAPPSQAAQTSPFDDPKVLADPKWWVENTARMAPSFVGPMGAGLGARAVAKAGLPGLPKIANLFGAGVGGLFGGALEGAQTYEEGLELGKDESTAATAGEAMALGSGVLNALPFYKIMNPAARGVIYNFLTRGMTEGVTEAMEEPLDEIIQGLVYDKEPDWEDVARRAAHVAGPAALMGGIGGAGAGVGKRPQQTETAPGEGEAAQAQPEEIVMEGGVAQEEPVSTAGIEVEELGEMEDAGSLEREAANLAEASEMAEAVKQEIVMEGPAQPEQGTEGMEVTDRGNITEEITMEGHAQPDLSDFFERGGIARNDGTLFPTKKAAQLKAKSRKLASYEPVKIGSGWGLRPAAAQTSAETPISAPQTPQEAGKPVQPESPQDLDQAAQQAATSPQNKTPEPSPEAIEAGNYRKGHVKINGMDVSIENPKGSTRSGTNRKGKQWSRTLKDHYGYIRQSEARDGEQVDVFLADQAHDTSRPVFVVDQVDPETGRYDEPKAIMGTLNEDQARRVYQRNYEDGWQGLGAITQMSQDEFKAWTQGDTTKPVALKEKPTRQPKAEAKPKAEEKEKPAPQKPEKAQQSDLVGQYVRSGSTTGKVKSVSEDGKKATLESGGTVPVGRAPNWAVQSEPFEGAKKRAAKEKKAEKEKLATDNPEKKAKEPEQKIEDFGEVLEGARKHYAQKLKDAESVDIAAEPLSKSWPEPNYQQLLDEGIDPWTVAFVHAARDEVPRKPAKSWKLKQWAKQVVALRGTAENMLSHPETAKAGQDRLADHPVLGKFADKVDLYLAVGHEKSLKGINFGVSRYSMYNGEKFSSPKKIWEVTKSAKATAFGNMPRTIASGDTKEQAIEAFKRVVDEGALDQSRTKNVRFDVYSRRNESGTFYVGKKVGRDYVDLESFGSAKEAREYLKNNQEALEKKLAKLKEIPDHRKESNSPRVGVDHRNGADVTPEQFTETFGFRGVQFGNYVEGPRRQQDLNETYDALMDLAGILNLPAKSLSLNGELGLAFGARGKGGKRAAKAHFEPDNIVINLTKRSGAGSLAHEWWHSLDNYFARQRGGDYLTETADQKREGVRPEMVEAFREVTQAINRTRLKQRSRQLDKTRTRPYWSTGREMSARSFESYVIERLRDQEGSNDYLANIVSEDYWNAAAALGMEKEGTYPYPEAAEIPEIRVAFDNFFQTVETRETDQGTAMFSVEQTVEQDFIVPTPGRREALLARLEQRKELTVEEALELFSYDPSMALEYMDPETWSRRALKREARNLDTAVSAAEEDAHAVYDAMLDEGTEDTYPSLNRLIGDKGAVDTLLEEFSADSVEGLQSMVAELRPLADIQSAALAVRDAMPKHRLESFLEEFDEALDQRNNPKKEAPVRSAIKVVGDHKGQDLSEIERAIIRFGSNSRYTKISDISEEAAFDREAAIPKDEMDNAVKSLQKRGIIEVKEVGGMFSVDTESDAFQRWFQDSKVVDENGDPLVVYHGTADEGFTEFQPERAGEVQYSDWGSGIYLTPSESQGDRYRVEALKEVDETSNAAFERLEAAQAKQEWKNGAPVQSNEVDAALAEFRRARKAAGEGDAGRVIPAYVSIQNPYIQEATSTANPGVGQMAREQGHDGVIVLKPDGSIDEVVAFRPEQIKSVDNRGTFSPTDPNILRSETAAQPRGMSVTDATSSLRQIIGKKAFDRLVASGRFEIVQKQAEIPEVAQRSETEPVRGRVKGMYSPTERKTYIVSGNIRPEQLQGVFLHEVGAHYGLPRMIGRSEYEKVKRQLQNLHRIGNKRVVAARNRVPNNTPKQYVWDETLAYLAENPANHNMSLLKQVWTKIKAFLKEIGVLHAIDLSDADIVQMVGGAAKHAARTAPRRPVRTRPGVYDKVAKGLTPKGTAQSYAKQVRQMVRNGQITQSQADRIIPWLNQHKRTPSPSERLDETVLDIPAKRSKVIRRDDVLAFLSSQGLMSQENRRRQRLRDMGMDFENLPGDEVGSQTRATEPVDQEPDLVDSETARDQLRKKGLNGPDAPEGMFSIEREYTEEQKRAIEKGRFGERGAQPTARERINASKYLIGTKFRQKVLDQFASLNKVLGDPRAWMMAQVSKGSTGTLEAVIEFGRPFLKDNAVTVDIKQNGLKDVLNPLGEEMDDWLKWMAGNRAANLKQQDRERLFDEGDIEALQSLNQGRMADGRNRAEVYEQVRQEYEALNRAVNQIAVDTGLVSEQEAQEWADQGFYLPFYRMMEDEVRGPGVFKNSLSKQTAYKKLKGADIPLNDLLGNIIENWHHLLSASMRNQAAVKAMGSAQNMGIAQQVSQAEASKDAIWVREDGEQVWYEFDDSQESKLVLESLLSLNYEGMQQFSMKVMRKFKRALTVGVTVNPEFRIANLIRDTLHSAAVVPVSPNIVKNVIQGVRLTKRGTESHAAMIAGGGAFGDSGYIHGTDPELLRRTMMKGTGRDTILDTRGRMRKMWDRYQDWGARMENVNRAAAFAQALHEGKDLLEANFEARDLLDFQRSGSATFVRVLTQTIPFLNARLQGLDRMYRAVRNPKQRRQFATVTGVYALAAVGLYLMMRDDEDYEEAEEWEKDAYHLFKIPGSEVMYRIPKPFEVGVIGTMAERLTEQVVDDNAHGMLFVERMWHALQETLSFNPIPQAALPMIELVSNKNFFTGRNIENLSMSRLSPEERKRAWTSQTAIGASQAMSKILWDDVTLSPVQVEHLVNGYLGWMGGSILGATDMLVSRPLAQSPDQPERRVEDYPVVGRFIREADSRNSKFVTRFYENLNDVTYAWGDIRQARELSNREKAKAKIEENRDVLKFREAYNRVQRDFGKINSRITQIHMDEKLTPKQKRNKIDLLNKRKKQIARRIVEASSDAFH